MDVADELTLLLRQVKQPDRDRLLTVRVAVTLGAAWFDSVLESSSSRSPCLALSALAVLLSTDLSMTPELLSMRAMDNN